MKKHSVIIVPGLGDDTPQVQLAVRNWEKRFGLTPHVFRTHWKKLDEDFKTRKSRLLQAIDSCSDNSTIVSIVGYSAGASLSINAYAERKEKISALVLVCGRLAEGKDVSPTLEEASKLVPAFEESVRKAEKICTHLTVSDKAKMMTITPKFGDEIVPVETAVVAGVSNRQIPTIEHVLSIVYVFLFPKIIVQFLSRNRQSKRSDHHVRRER